MTNKAVIGSEGLKVVKLTTEDKKEKTKLETDWINLKDDRLKQMLR